MLFDSHTHVNFKDFDEDRGAVIKRCLDEKIWMVNVGTDVEHSKKAIELAHMYPEGVYASVGIHPHDVGDNDDFAEIETMASDAKVVGIGEAGLDYFRSAGADDRAERKKQQELFVRHIELAKKTNKALIVHSRDSFADTYELLKPYKGSVRGVMHFFCGSAEEALAYCDLGFYISFSGVVTFARDYDATVRAVPLDRIVVETDAPFVAPVPFRGKRNEPRYVEYVARKIAELKGINFEETAERTTRNARELFGV